MSTEDVIDMVQCPYCKENWIRADEDMTCSNCSAQMDMDVNLVAIAQALSRIKSRYRHLVETRRKSLEKLRNELEHLLGEDK